MDKKSDEQIIYGKKVQFEPLTVGTNEDGGYKRHYKTNVASNPEQSNDAVELHDMNKDTDLFKDIECPKCNSTNLFNSLHENYIQCEECDYLFLKDKYE